MSHFQRARQLDVMKHFPVFLLALVLSAVVALGDMPRGFGRPSDVYMGMLANLTSVESTDKNVIERDGIKFETLVPERVLTLPKNEQSAYTPVRFGVRLTNNTLTAFRFCLDAFTPEFMAFNGEILFAGQLQVGLVFRTESDFPLVRPGEIVMLFWEGNFYWRDQNIYLQIPDRYSTLWFFRGFKPDTYKVRFTYTNADGERWYRDRERIERKQLRGILTGNFSSPWTDFSFVLP